jgi:hypothetical protein
VRLRRGSRQNVAVTSYNLFIKAALGIGTKPEFVSL